MKYKTLFFFLLLIQFTGLTGQTTFGSADRNMCSPNDLIYSGTKFEQSDFTLQAAENSKTESQKNKKSSYSNDLIFELKVANDMTFFTDHYFSSGVNIIVYAPFIARSPFNKIMLSAGKESLNYSALTFTHNLYTPIYYDTLSNRSIDHPFAAYILIGNRKESFNVKRQFKLTSELQLGVIGPIAGGQVFQNTLHEYIPIAGPVEGWEDQISNDLCLQYSAMLEKGILNFNYFELNANTGAKLGIPHTEGGLGLYCRLGCFDVYFKNIGISKDTDWQVWLFCAGDANLVIYNAVLQGGLLNRAERHNLQNINHVLWHTRFGGTLVYKTIKFEIAQEVISPSFPTALWHRWAYVSLMLGF